jgi:hypothetical protein
MSDHGFPVAGVEENGGRKHLRGLGDWDLRMADVVMVAEEQRLAETQ